MSRILLVLFVLSSCFIVSCTPLPDPEPRYLQGTSPERRAEAAIIKPDTSFYPGGNVHVRIAKVDGESVYFASECVVRPGVHLLDIDIDAYIKGGKNQHLKKKLMYRFKKGHNYRVEIANTKEKGFLFMSRDAFFLSIYDETIEATVYPPNVVKYNKERAEKKSWFR